MASIIQWPSRFDGRLLNSAEAGTFRRVWSEAFGVLQCVPGPGQLVGGDADGGEAPPAAAFVEVAEIVLQPCQLHLSFLASPRQVVRGDGAELVEPLLHPGHPVLQRRFRFESAVMVGGVDDPALVVGDAPVALEVVDGLAEVVGDGVDGGVVSGPAHGDVAEFSAAARGEDVGGVVGGALGSVHGEGVGVVEVMVVDHLPVQDDVSSFTGPDDEASVVRIDLGDGQLLAGHDPGGRDRGEGDDSVTGRVGPSAGGDQVGAGEVAGLVVAVAGQPVQVGHVLASPCQQRGPVSVVDVLAQWSAMATRVSVRLGVVWMRSCSAYQATASGTEPSRSSPRATRSAGSRWRTFSSSVVTSSGRRSSRAWRAPPGPMASNMSTSSAIERVDLQRALLRLPKRQREVVVLRFLADLPEAEVAESLGCSTGTVKSHASRGLVALRLSLGEV